MSLDINDHQRALATGKDGVGDTGFDEVHLAGLHADFLVADAQAQLAADHQQAFVVSVDFQLSGSCPARAAKSSDGM
jgi:hypothetical protein